MSIVLIAVASAILSGASALAQDIWFVDADAPGGGDGASWGTAFDDLQDALSTAVAGDQIWIAEGEYRPSVRMNQSQARSVSFLIPQGVTLYGGFEGNESNLGERDWTTHLSVLTGDLNDNDLPNFQMRDDNAWHVVTVMNAGPDALVLDGLVLSGGHAVALSDDGGGALRITGGTPIIANCTFIDNLGNQLGGAVYADATKTVFNNCTFTANQAGVNGLGSSAAAAAVYSLGGRVDFNDCMFTLNVASNSTVGGGANHFLQSCTFMHNQGLNVGAVSVGGSSARLTIDDSTFDQNESNSDAAIHFSGFRLIVRDCFFTNNTSDQSTGAMRITASDSVLIARTIFANNSAVQSRAGAIFIRSGNPITIRDCDFTGNTAATRGGAIEFLIVDNALLAPLVEDCAFVGISAQDGGAIAIEYTHPNALYGPHILSCEFSDNTATRGGAILNEGSVVQLTGVTLDGNAASVGPGVALLSGGMRGNGVASGNDSMFVSSRLAPGEDLNGDITAVFNAPGGITISEGDRYTMFDLDLRGTQINTQADQVNVGSMVLDARNAALHLTLGGGYVPLETDAVPVVAAGGIIEPFSVVQFVNLPSTASAGVDYGTGVTVHGGPTVPEIMLVEGSASPILSPPRDLDLADVNGDGLLDVLVTTSGAGADEKAVRIYKNLGIDASGNWLGFAASPVNIVQPTGPRDTIAIDFDRDGRMDFATTNSNGSGEVWIWRNVSDETIAFELAVAIPTGESVSSIAEWTAPGADLPGVAVITPSSNRIRFFGQPKPFEFEAQSQLAITSNAGYLLSDDFDGDGLADFVFRSSVSGQANKIVAMRSSDNYAMVMHTIETGVGSLTIADLDGDGDLDALSGLAQSAGLFYLSGPLGDPSSNSIPVAMSVLREIRGTAAADLDGDGRRDILTVDRYENGRIHALRNLSQGEGLVMSRIPQMGDAYQPDLIATGDFNLDGRIDVVVVEDATFGSQRAYINQTPVAAMRVPMDVAINFGSLLEGNVFDLRESDDRHFITRSTFGFSVLEPELMEIKVGFNASGVEDDSMTITTESRINHPIGTATVKIRNWASGQFETVGTYSLGFQESVRQIGGLSTLNRIREADGRIEIIVRHSIAASFSATGFDSSFDRIDLTFE